MIADMIIDVKLTIDKSTVGPLKRCQSVPQMSRK
jgi:hypothetical protein